MQGLVESHQVKCRFRFLNRLDCHNMRTWIIRRTWKFAWSPKPSLLTCSELDANSATSTSAKLVIHHTSSLKQGSHSWLISSSYLFEASAWTSKLTSLGTVGGSCSRYTQCQTSMCSPISIRSCRAKTKQSSLWHEHHHRLPSWAHLYSSCSNWFLSCHAALVEDWHYRDHPFLPSNKLSWLQRAHTMWNERESEVFDWLPFSDKIITGFP